MAKVFRETEMLVEALRRYRSKRGCGLTRERGETQSVNRYVETRGNNKSLSNSVLVHAFPKGTRLTWSRSTNGTIKDLQSDKYLVAGVDPEGNTRTWLLPMRELYKLVCERWAQYEKENGRSYDYVAFQLLPPSSKLRTASSAMYIADWAAQYELVVPEGKSSKSKGKQSKPVVAVVAEPTPEQQVEATVEQPVEMSVAA